MGEGERRKDEAYLQIRKDGDINTVSPHQSIPLEAKDGGHSES